MDFSLSEEQTLLQESIARYMQNGYPFTERQKVVQSAEPFSAEHWRSFAELGWLGVQFPEADGGFGGGAVESMLMWEQFGKGLVIEPLLATVVLAGGVLRLGGDKAQKEALLPGLLAGETQAALAFAEPQGRYNLADLTTKAAPSDGGYRLNGYKAVVLNGPLRGLAGGFRPQRRRPARCRRRIPLPSADGGGRRQPPGLSHCRWLHRLGNNPRRCGGSARTLCSARRAAACRCSNR